MDRIDIDDKIYFEKENKVIMLCEECGEEMYNDDYYYVIGLES